MAYLAIYISYRGIFENRHTVALRNLRRGNDTVVGCAAPCIDSLLAVFVEPLRRQIDGRGKFRQKNLRLGRVDVGCDALRRGQIGHGYVVIAQVEIDKRIIGGDGEGRQIVVADVESSDSLHVFEVDSFEKIVRQVHDADVRSGVEGDLSQLVVAEVEGIERSESGVVERRQRIIAGIEIREHVLAIAAGSGEVESLQHIVAQVEIAQAAVPGQIDRLESGRIELESAERTRLIEVDRLHRVAVDGQRCYIAALRHVDGHFSTAGDCDIVSPGKL